MKSFKTTLCSILSTLVFAIGLGGSAFLALALRTTRDYDWATLGNACVVVGIFLLSVFVSMKIRKIGGCE